MYLNQKTEAIIKRLATPKVSGFQYLIMALQASFLLPLLYNVVDPIMAPKFYKCVYCGRDNFLSQRGLTQHIAQNQECNEKEKQALTFRPIPKQLAHDSVQFTAIPSARPTTNFPSMAQAFPHLLDKVWENNPPINSDTLSIEEGDNLLGGQDSESEDHWSDISGELDTTILLDFVQYQQKAGKHFMRLSTLEQNSIELMSILRKSKASLGTYDDILAWHLRASGKLLRHESPKRHPDFVSREPLINKLMKRYNIRDVNKIEAITLPSSRARATIIKNDVKMCLQSLLTDPRIEDDDYLFFNDNPLSSPGVYDYDNGPIGDINTGLAYKETYDSLILRPGREVLLPIIFYIDGAATGQFADLPITALKFTLGIFNRKAREKPHMWRTLGYLPQISKHRSQGKRNFRESGHVDAPMAHPDLLEGEGELPSTNVPPAQDLHTMLSTILAEFKEIQKTGFVWDLMYKNRLWKGIEFVLFVPFIKADTEEADRLCGHYTSRGRYVAQLCRYCCCPTGESDQPRAQYPRKTVSMIDELVQNQDLEGLRMMSQQNISNAFYSIRFGKHNHEGIHGACPLEMLHALLLGIFKYIRDCFFEQIGEKSQVADEINALAVEYGDLISRQSDRNLPKTKFANGLQKGKLMAKEYSGVLLILAAILRSTHGRELLIAKNSSTFAQDNGVDDWLMLVETLLMWEAWLKSDKMERKHVRRSRKKHLYIMYMIRRIGDRKKGMGFKTVKYHAIMHMTQDIINFGVPMNYDTGADESGHKPAKTAAKLTQKRKDTFDKQVSERLTEVQVLDFAMAEIMHHRPVWTYFDPKDSPQRETKSRPNSQIYGTKYVAGYDEEGESYMYQVFSGREEPIYVEAAFVDFVAKMDKEVATILPNFEVYTTYRDKNGDIFRGAINYQGAAWRDWVMIDWGEDGCLPCKIWGFVDLQELPPENDLYIGNVYRIPPGVYAIVESAERKKGKKNVPRSELWDPIDKIVAKKDQGTVVEFEFSLADVDAFDGKLAVVPDLGGQSTSYLMLRPRSEWAQNFERWLERPYEEFEDFESDDDEAGANTSEFESGVLSNED